MFSQAINLLKIRERGREKRQYLLLLIQIPLDLDCKTVRIFEKIQVHAGSQTKGLERRFAPVRLLRHALTISLLILRKKTTLLQLACSRRSDSRAREKNSRRKKKKKTEGRLEGERGRKLSLAPPLTAALYYLNDWNRLFCSLLRIRKDETISFICFLCTHYPPKEFRCTVGHWKLTKMAACKLHFGFSKVCDDYLRDSRSNQKECRK